MGLLSWLFGSDAEPSTAPPAHRPRSLRASSPRSGMLATLPGPGTFQIEVVGESHYQGALQAVCGPRCPEGEDRFVRATLVHEDSNAHDPKAVRVDIQGQTVGYLSRETARLYRAQLRQAGHPGITAGCAARIRGGWDRGGGDQGHYGVWLDLPVV
jgi:HIRAN domain-containing protein